MEHKGTVTLESERLILRRFTMEDVETSFQNWTQDESMTKYLRWKVHESMDVTKNIISTWIKHYEEKDFYQWAIILKETGEVIGTISVVGMKDVIAMVRIGYCIGNRWWNQGYTSEAMSRLISFFFEQVKVARIEGQHDLANIGSGKVMKKCGLVYEGTLRKRDWNNQGIVDTCIYGLLAEDYFSLQKDLEVD